MSGAPFGERIDKGSEETGGMVEESNGEPEAAADTEEIKRKFREALEQKNERRHASVRATGPAKISNAHGAESHKRDFRRKSG
jgi:hypothetical protein